MASSALLKSLLAAGLLALTVGMAGCKSQARPGALNVGEDIETTAGEVALPGAEEFEPEEFEYAWRYPNYPSAYEIDPLNRSYLSERSISELGSYAGPWLEGAEAEQLPVAAPNVVEGERIAYALAGLPVAQAAAADANRAGAETGEGADGTGRSAPGAGSVSTSGSGFGPVTGSAQGSGTSSGAGTGAGRGNAGEGGPATDGQQSPDAPVGTEAGGNAGGPGSPQALLALLRAGRGGPITPALLPTLEESPFQAYLKLRAGLRQARYNNAPLTKDQLWSLTFALYRGLEPDIRPDIETPVQARLDPEKRQTGAQIFGANCAMCHGADGWGRGHSGQALQPPPANFHDPRRLFNRSETKLYDVLRHGIYGSAMPPWNDKLSEQEIRHVVAFIRSFSYSTEDPLVADSTSAAPQVDRDSGGSVQDNVGQPGDQPDRPNTDPVTDPAGDEGGSR